LRLDIDLHHKVLIDQFSLVVLSAYPGFHILPIYA